MVEGLGLRIKQAIEYASKKQNEIAEEVGVSAQAVNKWIRTGKIDRNNLFKLANVTHVSAEWLATGMGQMAATVAEEAARYRLFDEKNHETTLNKKALTLSFEFIEAAFKETFFTAPVAEKTQTIAILYKLFLEQDANELDKRTILRKISTDLKYVKDPG